MRIQDILFEPDIHDDIIKTAEDWLVSKTPVFGHTANFCKVLKRGEIKSYLSNQCHNNMGSNAGGYFADIAVVATDIGFNRRFSTGSYKKTQLPPELQRFYIKWFLNDAPFSRFVLTKDEDFALNHGIVIPSDINTALMQLICITSRNAYECSDEAFVKFKELCDAGIHSWLAWVSCFSTPWSCLRLSYDEDPCLNQAVSSYVGHRGIHFPRTLQCLKNLLNGELGTASKEARFLNDPSHYYRNLQSIYGNNLFFSNSPVETLGVFPTELIRKEEFREILKEFRSVSKDDMYHPPNPFKPKTTQPNQDPSRVSHKELFEVVLPYVQSNLSTFKGDSE